MRVCRVIERSTACGTSSLKTWHESKTGVWIDEGLGVIEFDNDSVRAKLAAVAGAPLTDLDVIDLLAEAVSGGGGVHIEIDEASRYKLTRREGRFVLSKEPRRGRPSTVPPRSTLPPRR